MIRLFFLSFLCINGLISLCAQSVFFIEKGTVYFKSDAPLELIEATSKELKGAIDAQKRTFAFTVEMATFEGFNSPLQREHFNENYLESHLYPQASFLGKIIENVDLTKDGTYTVRAKGQLSIHGITQERIIKSTVVVKKGKLRVESDFTVFLKEHDIAIPKIVYQKIAEEIKVRIRADFAPQKG
ncbi:MAG: YceI family protein [Bacteroidetes bacterium]|nr:MAG: YceI family protein [Bacteroidota bacterium]